MVKNIRMNKTPVENQLFALALQARKNAYVPYSRFAVGAAVESGSGRLYAGCNVENVSYPVGTCAEAGAIAAMVAAGEKLIRRILITADSPELITPCGACLQRIKEFSSEHTEILLADTKNIRQTLTVKDLLPFAFNNDDLKND